MRSSATATRRSANGWSKAASSRRPICRLRSRTRFPIDHNAARKLPLKTALAHRALPILLDGIRLVVAVDKPARVPSLQALFALKGFQIIPVLASKGHILLALSSLPHLDGWSDNVTMRVAEHYADSR